MALNQPHLLSDSQNEFMGLHNFVFKVVKGHDACGSAARSTLDEVKLVRRTHWRNFTNLKSGTVTMTALGVSHD